MSDDDDREPTPAPRRAAAPARARGPFPFRMAFAAVIAVCIVMLAVLWSRRSGGFHIPPASSSRVDIRPTPNVLVAIRDMARLESVNFHMERVVEITDTQTRMWGLVTSHDSLLLIAVGDVVAGVDLERIRPGDVETDWTHRRVVMRLPPPQVFSSALDETQTRVYRRTTDTLASRREDLEERARREAASTMRRSAIDAGILTRARSSAERAVRSLVRSLGFEDITIDFRSEDERSTATARPAAESTAPSAPAARPATAQ